MLRLALILVAIPLLLAGCSGSDIAAKAGWDNWPHTVEQSLYYHEAGQ